MKTLKASSLLEITVAMVLLGIIFSVSLQSFIAINHNATRYVEQQYEMELQAMAEKIKHGEIPEVVQVENNIRITVDIKPYQGLENLQWIHLTAWSADSTQLASHHELWYKRNED